MDPEGLRNEGKERGRVEVRLTMVLGRGFTQMRCLSTIL